LAIHTEAQRLLPLKRCWNKTTQEWNTDTLSIVFIKHKQVNQAQWLWQPRKSCHQQSNFRKYLRYQQRSKTTV